MFNNYIKIAVRNFVKRRVYSLVNIVGLSIAITSCFLVYLFVSSELNYDKFHENIDNIYRLNTLYVDNNGDWEEDGSTAPVKAPEIANEFPEVLNYTRLTYGTALVNLNGEYVNNYFTYADPAVFDMFSFPLIRGEYLSLNADPNSVIISEDFATRWFQSIEVIGKTVSFQIKGSESLMTIKGVMKNIPDNSSIKFDILIPFQKYINGAQPKGLTNWNDWHVSTFFLLDEEVANDEFEDKITAFGRSRLPEKSRDNFGLAIQPLIDVHFNEHILEGNGVEPGGKQEKSWILIFIAFFIIVIACINFTNLSIAITLPRVREIGVRKVVGANKKDLIKQFLGETFIFSLAALILAVLFTDLLLPSFGELTNKSMNLWQQLDLSMLIFVIGLLIMLTLLSGGYPAFIIAQFDTIRSLKGQERVGGGHNFVTKTLLVIQFSLAIIFMLFVGVMIQQINFLYQSDKGYNDEGIVTVHVFGVNGEQTMNQMRNQLATSAYVKVVTGHVGSSNWTDLPYNGELYDIRHDRIDYDYIPTMEIDLLVGRNFNPNLESDKVNSIIVNQAFLDKVGLGIDEAIGTKIPFDSFGDLLNPEIIGVIKNYNFESLRQEVKPQLMYVNQGKSIGELIIKIDENNMSSAVEEVRKAWLSIFPNRPFNFNYLELRNRQMYNAQESQKKVILYTGIISILISCLGLFALSSLHIQQRSKEVGIRKVLGASLWKLLLVLSKDFSVIILVAICISMPLAWYISEQWLSQFIYRTEIQISLFFLTSLLVISLAYISISYQTIVTANINPVDSLKDE